MIKKLRYKFIAVSALAILIVLILVVSLIDGLAYARMQDSINLILDILVENNGNMPVYSGGSNEDNDDLDADSQYEVRFFSVCFDDNGYVANTFSGHITAVDYNESVKYATQALKRGRTHGTLIKKENFYSYRVVKRKNSTLVVFVDTTNRNENYITIVEISVFISIFSFLMFVILISIFSGRLVRPFVVNYEKQKMFITNAGHELKTPLAVISANTEVIEMMNGESEWTKSTLNQVKRLNSLVADLITLSRAEELEKDVCVSVDFSSMVKSNAENFRPVIENQGKHLDVNIEKGVTVTGVEKSLDEVVSILLDNAAKYCDDGGNISVILRQKGRKAILHVKNTFKNSDGVDTDKFFDRFYRQDESHNSEKKGYGIGLSMAQNIVNSHKGKISAVCKDGVISFNVVLQAGERKANKVQDKEG